ITRQLKASKKITSVFYDIDARILNTLDAKFQLDKYEGNFPDYKKVIPPASAIDTGNASLIGVDPEQLILFDKSVIIHFTTGRDGVMLIEPYQSTSEYPWFGVLMPMNVNVNRHYSHINILKYVHALKEQVEVPICA
ncbi:MAG: hypothetical protein NUW09_02210, partial [Deltaproteobacteria bacterium]|nr:hypothetical protein [Deltaproteobacteria bacterium]